MDVHPRIDGTWLAEMGEPFGEVAWSTGERGCKEASWSMALPKGHRPDLLTGLPLVELMVGASCIWAGLLAEADWAEGRFHALGLAAGAERFFALDAGGDATARADVAIDRAIDRGWQVLGRDGWTSTPFVTDADLNRVAPLLDGFATEAGTWWMVHGDRIVRLMTAPTDPDYVIAPGIVDLGVADDDYASTILVRYEPTGGGFETEARTDADAEARFGPSEADYDVTSLGPISLAKAQALGDGVLAKGRSRIGWTEPIEVTANDLLTAGGVPASLPLVRSGQMIRVYGVNDDYLFLQGRTYLDLLIGETDYAAGAQTVKLAPFGKVASSMSEVMEELLRNQAEAA